MVNIMYKPNVGKKLFLVDYSRLSTDNRNKPYTSECEVILSGRKFFHVKILNTSLIYKFYIDSWREVSKYHPTKVLYENKKEYEDHIYFEDIKREVRKIFNYIDTHVLDKYSLEDMKEIKNLIDKINLKYLK